MNALATVTLGWVAGIILGAIIVGLIEDEFEPEMMGLLFFWPVMLIAVGIWYMFKLSFLLGRKIRRYF